MKHRQLDHYEVMERQHETSFHNEIILILDDLQTSSNIAGIFRICDAFQIKKIYLLSTENLVISKKFRSIARLHEKDINFSVASEADILRVISDFTKEKYQVLALEFTTDSTPLPQLKTEAGGNYILIAGTEKHGIRPSLLAEANSSLHIPMQGKISSINVMQAVSIALYELRRSEILAGN